GVQHRRFGAIDADERPRERTVERVLRARSVHPRPRRHRSLRANLDHFLRRFTGDGVVLHRGNQHSPVARPRSDDDLLTQAGEERAHHWSGGAAERILDDERGGQNLGAVCHRGGTLARKLEHVLVSNPWPSWGSSVKLPLLRTVWSSWGPTAPRSPRVPSRRAPTRSLMACGRSDSSAATRLPWSC